MKITIPIITKQHVKNIKTNKKWQIGLLTILCLTVVLTVYGIQQLQEIRSRARNTSPNGLQVTNSSGTPLPYNGNNTYTTNSLEVKLKIEDIEKLLQ